MRDRLVALINEAKDEYPTIPSVNCCKPTFAYYLADRLLANGGILPLCKVGDAVYSFIQGIPVIYEGNVYEIIYNGSVCVYRGTRKGDFTYAFSEDDIGKTVFLTREEAEQALKGEHHAEIH